jgi:hypothetical protein
VFLRAMLGQVEAEEGAWLRVLYLFSGVEAIAFAAAGFLFGREVNRARAEQAESRADAEADRAETFQKAAVKAQTKGRVLTEEVRQLADLETPPAAAAGFHPGAPSPLRQLALRAERLFPPT